MKKVVGSVIFVCCLAASYTIKAKRQQGLEKTTEALVAQTQMLDLRAQFKKATSDKEETQANINASIPKKHSRRLNRVQKNIEQQELRLSKLKIEEKDVKDAIAKSISPKLKKRLQDLESEIKRIKVQLKRNLRILAPYIVSGKPVLSVKA